MWFLTVSLVVILLNKRASAQINKVYATPKNLKIVPFNVLTHLNTSREVDENAYVSKKVNIGSIFPNDEESAIDWKLSDLLLTELEYRDGGDYGTDYRWSNKKDSRNKAEKSENPRRYVKFTSTNEDYQKERETGYGGNKNNHYVWNSFLRRPGINMRGTSNNDKEVRSEVPVQHMSYN